MRAMFWQVIALLLASTGAPPAASHGLAAAAQGEEIVLPSATCRDLFLVPITLPPRSRAPRDPAGRTLWMIYDTGSSVTLVDPAALERATGRRTRAGSRVTLRDGVSGPLTFRRLPARVRPLEHIGDTLGIPVDGILSFTAFARLLVTLDYPAGELRVRSGELPPEDGREVLRYRADPRPFLEVEIGGARRSLLLDSGSTGHFAIHESEGIPWAVAPRPISAAMRINRVVMRRVGRYRGMVRVGPLEFERPVASLSDGRGSELLGTQILKHFIVTFDQANRRVHLAPAAKGPVQMEGVRGTGAAYRARANGFEVVHVLAGSPAEAADLRVGDLVVAIGGQPVAARGCASIDAVVEVGRPVVYRLERAGRQCELTVEHQVLVP
jgi:hypothetical protein